MPIDEILKLTSKERLELLVSRIDSRGGRVSFIQLDEMVDSEIPMYLDDLRFVIDLGIRLGQIAYDGPNGLVTTTRER